jgi:hypothetical protein
VFDLRIFSREIRADALARRILAAAWHAFWRDGSS